MLADEIIHLLSIDNHEHMLIYTVYEGVDLLLS
jgi:hypothetical protein